MLWIITCNMKQLMQEECKWQCNKVWIYSYMERRTTGRKWSSCFMLIRGWWMFGGCLYWSQHIKKTDTSKLGKYRWHLYSQKQKHTKNGEYLEILMTYNRMNCTCMAHWFIDWIHTFIVPWLLEYCHNLWL